MDVKKIDYMDVIRKYLPFLCLILVVVIFQIWSGGKLLSSKSLINEIFTLVLGTTGMVFLLSQGCMDFSIASNVAICCIVAARFSQINPVLSLPAGIIMGMLVGLCVGVLHAVFKVDSFIASLSVSFILTGVVENLLQNGSISCPFEMLKWNSLSLRIVVAVIVVVVGFLAFEKTRIGKESKIVGANPIFANQVGIHVKWVKIRGFMIMGAICGIVAFFGLIRSGTASTSTGAGFEVKTLNALLIGGMAISGGATCKYRSALLGALILACLSLGMSLANVSSLNQQVVEGLVYLAAICMTFDRKGMVVIK